MPARPSEQPSQTRTQPNSRPARAQPNARPARAQPDARPARAQPDARPARARPRTLRVLALLLLAGFVLTPRGGIATIAEQRARLPPPAHCKDEVAGIWRAHSFWNRQRQWYIFTVRIQRTAEKSNELKGSIRSHYWNGRRDEEQPPQCRSGLFRQIVTMPAKGRIKNGFVTFGGTSWTLDKMICGSRHPRYYPDNFSGRIDPKLQEFQSVNNDGGPAVNVPVVFRRIQCLDSNDSNNHQKDVKPPPFVPNKRGGCSCK